MSLHDTAEEAQRAAAICAMRASGGRAHTVRYQEGPPEEPPVRIVRVPVRSVGLVERVAQRLFGQEPVSEPAERTDTTVKRYGEND